MKAPATWMLIAVVVIGILVGASLYTVKEGEQTVLTQFGKPMAIEAEAGLKFKTPFIQKVHRLEKRLLPWDGAPENMQTRDKKRIFIDVWARWRIVDAMKYFQAVRTEQRGYKILDDLVDSAVRDVVARYNLIEAVRSTSRELVYESEELAKDAAAKREEIIAGRAKIEAEILEVASTELKDRYGMELTDVHIKRIDYNDAVRSTVYGRMISERQRIAQLFESEGEEDKNRILGLMRKELERIEGEMEQRSAEISGVAVGDEWTRAERSDPADQEGDRAIDRRPDDRRPPAVHGSADGGACDGQRVLRAASGSKERADNEQIHGPQESRRVRRRRRAGARAIHVMG